MGLYRIGREFNLKCVVVLIFSLSVFLSAVFWVIPFHSKVSGFDATRATKLRATVQASFRLQKPVSVLVPLIGILEYDINSEIGVPFAKVAILSMHQADASTWTNVVFGFLPHPIDAPMNPVSLSVLRSSLIELFLQQSNLTLTTSACGQVSSLEILKYPGGITIIPESGSIWQISQVLFNFTLNNSIYEVNKNLAELRHQLKLGLHLRSNENVYVQLTNGNGSTGDPPVTVQAAVRSNLGSLLPQRLRQLAKIITGSSPNNLGLNNTVFGEVKEVTLSSFLNQTILATPPTPSPAPAPEKKDSAHRPSHHSSPHSSRSPAPSGVRNRPSKQLVSPPLASPPISPSPSSSKPMWSFFLCGLLTFHLLCWS